MKKPPGLSRKFSVVESNLASATPQRLRKRVTIHTGFQHFAIPVATWNWLQTALADGQGSTV